MNWSPTQVLTSKKLYTFIGWADEVTSRKDIIDKLITQKRYYWQINDNSRDEEYRYFHTQTKLRGMLASEIAYCKNDKPDFVITFKMQSSRIEYWLENRKSRISEL